MPTSFNQGLLAGLSHPVVALEHLAAVIAVGWLAAAQARGAQLALGYVVATLVGVAAHIGEATVAGADVVVAIAVIALGFILVRGRPIRIDVAFALFAGAGLVNGYALGAPMAGARPAPLYGYALGLALIQAAIALAAMEGGRMLSSRAAAHLLASRVIGAACVGFGVAILLRRYGAAG
jgi:urease accessory protein